MIQVKQQLHHQHQQPQAEQIMLKEQKERLDIKNSWLIKMWEEEDSLKKISP